MITMSNGNGMDGELVDKAGMNLGIGVSSSGGLLARDGRALAKDVSHSTASALARAYRVEMEGRLVEHKVSTLASVARSAMSEVALVNAVEDTLIKGLAGSAISSVAVDRIDMISREFSIAAGDIMLRAARQISGI